MLAMSTHNKSAGTEPCSSKPKDSLFEPRELQARQLNDRARTEPQRGARKSIAISSATGLKITVNVLPHLLGSIRA